MDTAALDFAKNKNGHASTSLGVHALSKGDLGTAIGAGSRSDAIGSVALGTGAHATKQNAVAIGTGSTTDLVGTRQLSISYDKDGNIVDDNSPTKAYTFNWAGGTHTAEGDVVSFGMLWCRTSIWKMWQRVALQKIPRMLSMVLS